MSKRVLLLTALLISIPLWMFGQSSGKIVGVVKDANSGETLPGVNISLDGTTYGAASDVDGYFVILNVPVGSYNVRANFIGYGDQVYSGVRVSASKTTEVDFAMEETTIEGQAVVVIVEKPLVEKHVTQSVSLVTAEELENIPIRNFNQLLATQNSVIVQDNNIYIRGGRTEEVGYYLDGVSATNPLNNTQAVYVIKDAIEEFQVQAGGYTAEFGGANSGIVRTELRTGGSDFHASLDFQTDKLADEGEEFLGTYSYRHHIATATLGGPITNNVRFFIAGENNFEGDRQRRFSDGYSFLGLIDTSPEADAAHPDTVDLLYPNGFTPQNERERWALNSTLSFDFSPIRIRLSGAYQDQTTDINVQPMLRSLNERNNADEYTSLLLSGKITHVLSPKSLYEVNVGYFNSNLERVDDYFGNDWTQWWDSLAVLEHTGGDVVYASKYNDPHDYSLNGFPIERNGAARNFYRKEKINYLSGGANYFSQIGRHHEVKIGVEARQYTTRRFSIQPKVIEQIANTPGAVTIEDVPASTVLSNGRVNNYGYDHLGNEIDSDIDYGNDVFSRAPIKPLDAAFYLQDKVEYNDLIINLGLRWDYFDTKDRELVDELNPEIDQTTGYILQSQWQEKDAVSQLSPRVGFSFPTSDKTVFYMQYGKFIQKPELNDAFNGDANYRRQIGVGGNFFTNPVGFGLDPISTTSYEIGFRQQLSSVAALDVAGFYKNVIGQIQARQVFVDASSDVSSYIKLENGDFATTQGVEFGLTLRRTHRLQGQLNYTLTSSEGTGSDETAYLGGVAVGNFSPTVITPLNFAQKHVGSIILDYRLGKDEGGFLSQFGVNTVFSFNSGHPYTFVTTDGLGQVNAYDAGIDYMFDTRVRRALEVAGSSTTPWNFNVDLRMDKTFNLAENLGAVFYVRVTNLLNTQNVLNVYERSGNADDDGFLSNRELSDSFINQANLGQQYVDLYNAINLTNGQSMWDRVGRQLWDHPRQIFFGISLNY